ncbi:MAG: hypothetical protein ABIP90_09200 [Vicinamibacterales bacterium]
MALWLAIGLVVGTGTVLLYQAMTTLSGDDDRPPIIVRNGSVIVGEVYDGLSGTLVSDTSKKIWHHEHQRRGPQRFNVEVSGISLIGGGCSSTGEYFASKVESAAIWYSHTLADVTTERKFDVRIAQPGPNVTTTLEFTLDSRAKPYQDSNLSKFEVEREDGVAVSLLRVSVVKGKGNNAVETVCKLDSAATPEIRLNQAK